MPRQSYRMKSPVIFVVLFLTSAIASIKLAAAAEDWPQFRGPGGRAVSDTANPPIGFSEASNVVWKTAIPAGNSSPIVTGNRIFVTAENESGLETICLDRKDGHIRWKRKIGAKEQATPTPATDGTLVYVSSGSFGIVAYDLDGNEKWRQPHAKPDPETSASPILVEDKLIILRDWNDGSYLEAHDKKTGRSLWRTERANFRRSRATPFHWVHGGADELIVAGSLWLTSYDPRTGRENWRCTGTARWALASPAASENLLFTVNATVGAGEGPDPDSGQRPLSSFGSGPGNFANPEPPRADSALLAIRAGGQGDVAETHVAWKSTKALPHAPSPLFYKGRLFTVRNGGLVSAYDVKTGEAIYHDERINADNEYWASPVAAAGRVYLTSYYGKVTILDATSDKLIILGQNKLEPEIVATPALVEQSIVFRSAKNVFAITSPK
jgi:outer membrane protein assembly factor BamB